MKSSHPDMFAGLAQPRTSGPVPRDANWLNRRTAYFVVIVAILSIYSYPALRAAIATRSLRLPAASAADLGLYLSLSNLQKNGDGVILNPYYHIPVAYSVGYLKFRSGPALFGLLNHAFGRQIWFSLFTWNLFWWLLLCIATIWLFERWLPQASVELILAGLSLLMLVDVNEVGPSISSWIHLSPSWFASGLPYTRPFTPQVVMPLFLCYLALQFRALGGKSVAAWGAMAVLQFVAFTFFPYGTLMMAGTTAVAASWYVFSRRSNSAWRTVLAFLVVCALADIAFALHGSAGFRYGVPDQTSVIKLQPFVAFKAMGKLWLLTGTLATATAISPRLAPQVKWPLVGLGLSTIVLVLGDAFVSERLFLLNTHIGYFYQPAIAILLTFLVSAYLPSHLSALRLTKIVLLAFIGLCLVFGFLSAEGNYRTSLAYDITQADLANWFARGEVSAGDLVITQFTSSRYDTCEWIPLLSEAEVLYCRNSQLALTPEENRKVQRLREVMYLYFNGKDERWLDTASEFERYGQYGDLLSFHRTEEKNARVIALRQELRPLFERVEKNDPSIQDFFRRFRHVWIIQDRQDPSFVNARLESYLEIKGQESAGSLLVTSSDPR